jgi:hypothetical protein
MNNDKINRMTAKEYYKSSRMVETRNWTLEMALNFAEEYTEALHIHDVVGQTKHLPEGEKLCRMDQNFVCNCIDNSRCPNF